MDCLWVSNKRIEHRHVDIPVLQSGECLIQVEYSGVCSTDIQLVKGYYPYDGIIGHEFVGKVCKVKNEEHQQWIGKRVVSEINIQLCGRSCKSCVAGVYTQCEEREVLGIMSRHGAHAEYISVPVTNLIQVDASIPSEIAVFCEPLAASLEILEQVHIRPTDKCLVIGAGKLGLLIAQVLQQYTPAEVVVLAKYPSQQDILHSLGISTISSSTDLQSNSFGVVVDASGRPESLTLAIDLTSPRGMIIVKSTTVEASNTTTNLSKLVVKEIQLIGSRCGPMKEALRLLKSGKVNVNCLIEGVYTDMISAFDKAMTKGSLKVLIHHS